MNPDKAFEIIKNTMVEHNNAVEKNTDDILKIAKDYFQENNNKLEGFLNTVCLPYSEVKKETFEKYKIDNNRWFNFFESISDKWYRENFHTDILYTILNPETTQIGNKLFMQEFIKFLEIPKEKFDCEKEFKVIEEQPTGYIYWTNKDNRKHRKKGSIDILIKNETQAIILENKINYAPDMDNQLVRYMKYVDEKLHIKNYTIVYLTLTDDKNKKPPSPDSYDSGFQNYAEQLRKDNKILKEVYAVDAKKGLARDFLLNCCKRLEEKQKNIKTNKNSYNIATVYIDQYYILLNQLGGIVYMGTTDKKIIEKIFSSKENIETAIDFNNIWSNKDKEGLRCSDIQLINTIESSKEKKEAAKTFNELWDRRADVFYCVVNDLLTKQIEKMNIGFNTFNEDNVSGLRKDFGDFYICFYVYVQGKNRDSGIGFWRHNALKKKFEEKRRIFKELLEKAGKINGFKNDIYSEQKDRDWVCRQIDFNEIENNKILISDLVSSIILRLKYLDKEYSKISDK